LPAGSGGRRRRGAENRRSALAQLLQTGHRGETLMSSPIYPGMPPTNIANWEDRGPDYGQALTPTDPGAFFEAVKDTLNPLQHIPVVGNLYRRMTGDEIDAVPRILGGTLFLGIGGFVSGLVNAVLQNETGKDMGSHALAMVFGEPEPSGPVMVADATPVAPTPAAPAGPVATDPPLPQAAAPEPEALATLSPAAGDSQDQAAPPEPKNKPKIGPIPLVFQSAAPAAAPTPDPAKGAPAAVEPGRFMPVRREQSVVAQPRDGLPQPATIRAPLSQTRSVQIGPPGAPVTPAAMIAPGASAAYGKALELSNTIRDFYRPGEPTARPARP